MSISSKLALAIAAVVGAIALLGVGVAASWVAEDRREDFRRTQRQALELLALAVAPAMPDDDHHRVQAAVDNVANFPERFPAVMALEVLDRDGRVVADLDPRRFGTPGGHAGRDLVLGDTAVREAPGSAIEVVVPIELTHRLGVLRATVDARPLEASITRQRAVGVLIAVGLAVVVWALLYLLVHRLVARRLSRLAQVVNRVEAGAPLPEGAAERGADEIAELSRGFVSMSRALSTYTDQLESLVAERTHALEKANARLSDLATTDALTGLRNRRAFDEHLPRLLEVARRGGRELTVAILDLDHFKAVNDTHGHPVGDVVLESVAEVLRRGARSADLVARIGGEEFALVLSDTDAPAARVALERLRRDVAGLRFPDTPELDASGVTISIGQATAPADADDPDALVVAADRALYAAKEAGRDRVFVASELPARADAR